jgi:peroxiredoxin
MKLMKLTLGVCLAAVAFAKPPVPRPATDFRAVDAAGKPLEVAHHPGKVVVVQFLYTTCSHCQAVARMLSKLETELGPRGLQVAGVAFNPEAQRPEALQEFVKNNNVTFPVGFALTDSVLNYLGISIMERFVVPEIVIIDRGGVIRAQSDALGSPELQDESYLRNFLEGLLKSQPKATSSR